MDNRIKYATIVQKLFTKTVNKKKIIICPTKKKKLNQLKENVNKKWIKIIIENK